MGLMESVMEHCFGLSAIRTGHFSELYPARPDRLVRSRQAGHKRDHATHSGGGILPALEFAKRRAPAVTAGGAPDQHQRISR